MSKVSSLPCTKSSLATTMGALANHPKTKTCPNYRLRTGCRVLMSCSTHECLSTAGCLMSGRQNGGQEFKSNHTLRPPTFCIGPPVPDPPLTEFTLNFTDGHAEKEMRKCYDTQRSELRARGEPILEWQRPPHVWLDQQAGNERLVDGQDQVQQLKQGGSSEQAERAPGA